jgi:polyisoprenoid-binding protein YceI
MTASFVRSLAGAAFGLLALTGLALVPAVSAAAIPMEVGVAQATDTLVFVVAEEGNEARYRVREQLARLDFPNDAVGRTSGVQGRIMVTAEGEIIAAGSRFVIDLASLESDSDRRDNFLRRNTLGTNEHPEAIFVPREVRGLSFPLPVDQEAEFVLVGDMTIREVTRSVEWNVTAEFLERALLGRAATSFTFGDFGLEVPRVGSVLSIRDEIRLEFDFRMVAGG